MVTWINKGNMDQPHITYPRHMALFPPVTCQPLRTDDLSRGLHCACVSLGQLWRAMNVTMYVDHAVPCDELRVRGGGGGGGIREGFESSALAFPTRN